MPQTQLWSTVHAERRALGDDLGSLDDSKWETPSWCTEWSVRDVLAHMTATARISPMTFVPKLIGSGFSFQRLQARDIQRERGASPADTLAAFESIVTSTKRPPGPAATMLGETLIHAEDIRAPLGLRHDYPSEAAVQVADFYKDSNLIIGAKRRISGLRLSASDVDWSTGSGPEVSGPIMALVMAMTGRRQAIEQLSGEGVETLRGRS